MGWGVHSRQKQKYLQGLVIVCWKLFLILIFIFDLLDLLLKSKDWKPGNFFFQTPIPAGFPFRFQEWGTVWDSKCKWEEEAVFSGSYWAQGITVDRLKMREVSEDSKCCPENHPFSTEGYRYQEWWFLVIFPLPNAYTLAAISLTFAS